MKTKHPEKTSNDELRKADVLTIAPHVAPSIGGRLGKHTC